MNWSAAERLNSIGTFESFYLAGIFFEDLAGKSGIYMKAYCERFGVVRVQ